MMDGSGVQALQDSVLQLTQEQDGQQALSSSSALSSSIVDGFETEQVFQQQQEFEQALQDGKQQEQEGPVAAQVLQLEEQQPSAATASSSNSVSVEAPAASATSSSASSSWELTGEVYILLACCCYAIATVRLSMLAPGLDPVQLATSKTLTLAAASLCWLLVVGTGADVAAEVAGGAEAAAAAAGAAVSTSAGAAFAGTAAATASGGLDQASAAVQAAWASWQLPPAFDHGQGKLLLYYSALGPGALATVLQTKGQGTVGAAQAQVFYSLTPVWAALLAYTCLQGEEMGPLAWVGGCIIIAASIWAAISGSRSGSNGSDGASGQ
jgi:hypothetical protein